MGVSMNSEDNTFSALKYRRTVNSSGAVKYRDAEGFLHREDGPVCIEPDGTLIWYLNGDKTGEF